MSLINIVNERIVVPFSDKLMGTEIMKYLALIKKMSSWSPEEIRDWQNQRLKDLVEHAYNRTSYYKELFDKAGIKPDDINSIDDLHKIPILTKNDKRNYPEKFVPDNISDIKHRKAGTGGSTGDPLKYLLDEKSLGFVTAMRFYHSGKIGYRLGDKLAVLGGSSVIPDYNFSFKYKIYHSLNRKIFLSAVNMSDQVIDQHLEIIAKRKIEYIYGYTAAIYLIACRAEKRKLKLVHLKGCFTTSEILTPEYREKIETAFNCKVMDVYGANDGGMAAYESEPGIYQVSYNCIVEIEKENSEKNTGNILTTNLLSRASPFIRYRLGDQVSILESRKAKSYYNGQVITKVSGRISDVIRLENGNILTGVGFATFLFSKLNVHAYRIKKVGHMHIEIDIQVTENFTQDEEELITKTFKNQAGQECKISINHIENFEPLSSGKRNYFMSNA